ncbi:hypothetical protein Aab01nite_31310 [Paractinoplanes abujensis]|uniref:DUF1152 domain-containing protein n=1 Tax=Paractinoplanes abujensis TaxID=882441 RepID=A0A7W7G8I7_9ACTN|nr:DUF1152 domain-containing protein [Actinoplanes abujensis]MBB4697976.1 hypothetical protein [Actinoplanes abujensis]GID19541.1 hypothetical protein Aab01nite_31310 [Actinoplanes abujensis]
MTFSLDTPPLFAALAPARRVLIAGAGGGFDVYAGLPLALALWHRGVEVHLANLSFSELELVDRDSWLTEQVVAVTPASASPDWYFPEGVLAKWLASQDLPSTVYAFPPLGVQTLREAYEHLIALHDIDAVVLVDGGTDILMRGDENGIGTPVEDLTSVGAVAGIDVPVKLVTCLGFGIDANDGVHSVEVLDNLAALDREGGYLGALSIPGSSREARLYRAAVADAAAATPDRPSIVNGQIAAALAGQFGDVQFTRRTTGSTLFVNPLMAIYFTVDLDKLAARCLYLDRIENTVGRRQVIGRIEAYRNEVTTRIPRAYPH